MVEPIGGSGMTERQKNLIEKNLKAFVYNFGSVRIEKENYGKGFYVFYPEDSDSYIQYCYSIEYLDGWLYGCVQGKLRLRLINERERELYE